MIFEKMIADTVMSTLSVGHSGWITQWGVLARPHTRRIETSPGTFTDKVYPVARYVGLEDCEAPPNGGLYTLINLNPDQSYAGLVLIEQLAGATFKGNPQIPQRRGVDFSMNIAVKAWINFPSIDYDGYGQVTTRNVQPFANQIIALLHGQIYKNRSFTVQFGDFVLESGHLSKMRVQLVGEMDPTPQGVFGAYSFSRDQALMTNDYGIFGLIFNLSGLMITQCAMILDDNKFDTLPQPAC